MESLFSRSHKYSVNMNQATSENNHFTQSNDLRSVDVRNRASSPTLQALAGSVSGKRLVYMKVYMNRFDLPLISVSYSVDRRLVQHASLLYEPISKIMQCHCRRQALEMKTSCCVLGMCRSYSSLAGTVVVHLRQMKKQRIDYWIRCRLLAPPRRPNKLNSVEFNRFEPCKYNRSINFRGRDTAPCVTNISDLLVINLHRQQLISVLCWHGWSGRRFRKMTQSKHTNDKLIVVLWSAEWRNQSKVVQQIEFRRRPIRWLFHHCLRHSVKQSMLQTFRWINMRVRVKRQSSESLFTLFACHFQIENCTAQPHTNLIMRIHLDTDSLSVWHSNAVDAALLPILNILYLWLRNQTHSMRNEHNNNNGGDHRSNNNNNWIW